MFYLVMIVTCFSAAVLGSAIAGTSGIFGGANFALLFFIYIKVNAIHKELEKKE
ncbi:MAG: hypothetical protein JJT76_00070 [Clostridiaceae bacterium]|nr:hypothetical protein [Clostridiaceae bacterium]